MLERGGDGSDDLVKVHVDGAGRSTLFGPVAGSIERTRAADTWLMSICG